MKNLFAFLIITSSISTFEQNCNYKTGDIYTLKKQSVIIKEKPIVNGKQLASIKSNYGNLTFEIVDSISVNNFVKVIVSIINPEAVPEISKFDSLVGWIPTTSIEPEFNYVENWDIDYYDSEIEKQINLKNLNECKYSVELHAHLLSQRGIQKFKASNYQEAILDLTASLNISKSYKYLLRTYIYRAFAKEELKDYFGAIEDFNFIIAQTKLPSTKQSICKYCNLNENDFEWCAETILVQRAWCNLKLKKYQESLADLNLAIKINPKWGQAYFIRGQLKDILKDNIGCCKDLSTAGELGISKAYNEIEKRCGK